MQTTDFTNFMGIDVSKQTWDVYLSPSGQRRKLSANDDGARQLREALSSVGRCLIVMEATGGLEQRLVAELHDAGHTVAVVNPRQVRDFARCMNRLAKTDELDAQTIAWFAEKVRPRPLEKTR